MPAFSKINASSLTNAIFRSRKTLVVSFTALAVLQFGIGIKLTVKTCL